MPVAQLDRVSDSDSEGRAFESHQAYQKSGLYTSRFSTPLLVFKEGVFLKKNIISRFFGHFMTVTRHRHAVIRHARKAGILWQGLRHDLSKYYPEEFVPGVKYFQGDRSPNEMERERFGYSSAWLHHKGRNKHHFEHWTDYNPVERKVMPVKMPVRYVAEMFCDRVAASKIYQGEKYTDSHPYEYFDRGRARRFINPETSALLESWLVMLKEQGEDAALRHIKECVRASKKNR